MLPLSIEAASAFQAYIAALALDTHYDKLTFCPPVRKIVQPVLLVTTPPYFPTTVTGGFTTTLAPVLSNRSKIDGFRPQALLGADSLAADAPQMRRTDYCRRSAC